MTDATGDSNVGPAAAPPVIDTPEARDALECPLCGYSLRGLPALPVSSDPQDAGTPDPWKARCPECGYPFWWEQLLRARQHRHPYLFEHHGGVRAFFATLLAGLRPRRFWSSLHAGHRVEPARLFLYAALIVLLVAASVPCGHYFGRVFTLWRREWPDTSMWLDPALWQEALDDSRWDAELIRFLAIACAAWPWVTLAALLIFRISMQRARVRPAHVVRCVVYSGDVLIWTGIGLALGGALDILPHYPSFYGGARPIVLCVLPVIPIAGYRLGVAYQRYLRFDHPWSTVLASQVIYVLAVATVPALYSDWLFRLFW